MAWHPNNLTTLTGQRAIFDLTALINPNDPHTHRPTRHVFFLGRNADGSDDGHIHEFWWGNPPGAWQHNDLTTKTPGAADAAGVPSSYMFKGRGTKHVIYEVLNFGDPGRIGELYWEQGDWHYNDLTSAAGNAPRTIGDPFGYEYSFFDTIWQRNTISQRVVYQGRLDGRIHLLSREPNFPWHHTALTNVTNFRPTAYVFSVQGQAVQGQASQRVLYQLPDDILIDVQHIHELMWNEKGPNNSHWVHRDLTVLSGGPRPQIDLFDRLVGLMHDLEFTLHVFYRSSDQLYELWWNNSGWHVNDFTALTGAPPAAASPVAYVHLGQGTLNVIYPGVDGHIHALWRGEGSTWNPANHTDLTITAGAPPMLGRPVGFVFRDLTQHIFYIANTSTSTSPPTHIGDVIELTDE